MLQPHANVRSNQKPQILLFQVKKNVYVFAKCYSFKVE
ncbi:unnamed protein product [Larinioides sclopetarius]|uniref:Uncharacterized protein n=1 Tax=Larinioides sclopetarius TaxID=280406 RepID=A0AAV1YZ65_9ARAC